MDYVIKCGKNYIGLDGNGRYAEVSDVNCAIKAPLHKLNNIINNCVAPNKRSKCKIIETSKIVTKPTVVSVAEVPKVINHSVFTDIMDKFRAVATIEFEAARIENNARLSQVDKEITDIKHYIEFNKLNAVEGYKAYKMLRDKLLERRAIKNDYSKFQVLTSAKVSDIFDGTLDENLKALENKTYTPRVLNELFDNEGND